MPVSHWRMTRARSRPVERADVVVVGAGIVGLWTALELQQRGRRVTVVDRHGPGSGASTRNAGFLMRGAAEHYGAAVAAWGRGTARTLWRWSEENLAMLREAGIRQVRSYQARPSCVLALEAGEADELPQAAALMEADGFAAEVLEPGMPGTDDDAWRRLAPIRALVNPHDAVVNPADLIIWLSSRLDEPVRDLCEVAHLEDDGSGVTLSTSDGRIEARQVVVCTNAWASTIVPVLRGWVEPNRGQMLAVESPETRLDRAYYANRGSEYFRSAGHGVVVVGGCRTAHAAREVGFDDQVSPWVQDDLDAFARRLVGPNLRVVSRWAGTMGFSRDGLPIIGRVSPGVAVCVGFTGHGMSLGARSAREVVGVLEGGNEPAAFGVSRVLAR